MARDRSDCGAKGPSTARERTTCNGKRIACSASGIGCNACGNRLRKQIGCLKEALAVARRAGFRQAAPFAKDRPAGPRRTSQPSGGWHYGRHGCRQRPPRVDEPHTARTLGCPDCVGALRSQGPGPSMPAGRRPVCSSSVKPRRVSFTGNVSSTSPSIRSRASFAFRASASRIANSIVSAASSRM